MQLQFSTKFLLFEVFLAAVALGAWRAYLSFPDNDTRALPLLIIVTAAIPLICGVFGPRGMRVGAAIVVIFYVLAMLAMAAAAVFFLVQNFF